LKTSHNAKPAIGSKPVSHPKPGLTRPMTAEERRRAQRVLLRMRILVHIQGKSEPIEAATHTVSETGAMLILPDPVNENTKFLVENPKTQKTVEVRVVRSSQMTHEGSLVPVEFTAPAPSFWNVFFPPTSN
jgi:PilZ domain